MDLSSVSKLRRAASGLWETSEPRPGEISYPEDGNDVCFAMEDSSFWFRHRNRCLRELVDHTRGPFLDVGAGNGFVSRSIRESGREVVCVEPGPRGARNCRARGLPNVAEATLAACEFQPRVFGAVGAFDVIEHIEDPAPLLSEMRRVMRDDGHLLITVPAHAWLWSADDDDAGHFRRYTRRGLTQDLEAAGFVVEYSSYFFLPLVLPIWLARRVGRAREDESRAHHAPPRVLAAVVDALLAPEIVAIRHRSVIPSGSSILALATKRLDAIGSTQ